MYKHYNEVKYTKINKMFTIIVPILNKHNISYWASFGTLLGIIRDGTILPWDYDIDFSIDIDNVHSLLTKSFQDDLAIHGLVIKQSKNNTLKIYYMSKIPKNVPLNYYIKTTHIDFYIYKKQKQNLHRGCFYNWEPIVCNKNIQNQSIPISSIYPLQYKKLSKYGFTVTIPNNPIEILKQEYGDWNTPKYTHS